MREIAIDTETCDRGLQNGTGPGWATGNCQLCGVSAAWDGGRTYLPVRHPDTNCLDRGAIRSWIADLYRRSVEDGVALVFMNAPYDLGVLWAEFGLLPRKEAVIDDVGLMAVMCDENQADYSLDGICARLGLAGKDEGLLRDAAACYGFEGRVKDNLHNLPARYVGPYAEEDTVQTLACAAPLRARMTEDGVADAYRTEADLILCCVEMRRRGVRVDTEAVERGMRELARRRTDLLADLSHRLGRGVTLEHVRSWRHMAQMCDAEGVEYPRTEKTGQPSFKAEWMRAAEHWLPRTANTIDRITEAHDKFLQNYLLDFAHRGRIHPTYHQFKTDDGGTKTHRFSISGPPLQQAPGATMEKTDELGAHIVSLFRGGLLPEEGELWLSPDVSSQEIRLIVHFAAALGLNGADDAVARYVTDPRLDFHQFVADLARLPRSRAKAITFARAYGAGIAKMAAMMGMTLDEAKAVVGQYDDAVPFFKDLTNRCAMLADRRGYIKLIDGARCRYEQWEPAWRDKGEGYVPPTSHDRAQAQWPGKRLKRAYTFKSMNALIQGSAARQTKISLLWMWREGYVPLLTVHDENPISVSSEKDGQRVGEIMREAVKLKVPVVVDEEYGSNWANAKHTYAEARAMQS